MSRVKKRFHSWIYVLVYMMGTFIQISTLKLLEYMSSHSEHIKKSIICSQIFRLSRLFSFQQEFEGHKRNLRSWFVKRRYPEEIIDKEMLKVKFNFPKKINPKEKE